ncbi:MAG: ATP-binding protein [bacterium]|nr:ATP-binding protein [bacterium]
MAKILLVDDNQSARVTLSIALKSEGFTVDVVDSGEDALQKLVSQRYDWLISDVNMPGMSGIDLVRRIREEDSKLGVVLISAFRSYDELQDTPIDGFLEKPLDIHKLYQVLRKREGAATPGAPAQPAPDGRIGEPDGQAGSDEGHVIRFRDKREKEHFDKRAFGFYELLEKNVEERTRELVEKQKKLEAAYGELRKTKGYLEHLLDASPNCIISMDTTQRVLSFNTLAERTFGYDRGEIVGTDMAVLRPAHEAERMEEIFKITLAEGEWSGHATGLRKNGEVFPISLVTTKVLDEAGQVIAVLEMSRDITEEMKMEQQLLHAEKLSVLGQLAPKVAHEINNPLHVISANVQFGLMVLDDSDKVKSCLDKALQETGRIEQLTKQLMDVARPTELNVRQLSIHDLLANALLFMEDVGETKCLEVKKTWDPRAPLVLGDQAQLEQVFRNIILNASQAMEHSETKTLSVAIGTTADQRHVEVSISDTGCGIEAENLEKVFEPFFTTKRRGKGNGLGMSIVKGIVERHQGWIEVKSTPGVGSCIQVFLPVEPASAAVER